MVLELSNIDKLNDCNLHKEIPIVKLYGARYQSYVFNGGDDQDLNGGDDFSADGERFASKKIRPDRINTSDKISPDRKIRPDRIDTSGKISPDRKIRPDVAKISHDRVSNVDGGTNVTIFGMHPVTFGLTLALAGIIAVTGIIIVKNLKA